MKKSYIEFASWVAIILVVIVIGRWAFSVDTHAQEDGELGQGVGVAHTHAHTHARGEEEGGASRLRGPRQLGIP